MSAFDADLIPISNSFPGCGGIEAGPVYLVFMKPLLVLRHRIEKFLHIFDPQASKGIHLKPCRAGPGKIRQQRYAGHAGSFGGLHTV